MNKINKKYYLNEDVVEIAQDLLGKHLITNIQHKITAGIIVETEAYHSNERACHAYNNRRTPRTEVMFSSGGIAYVYQCYGIYYLFNIVTSIENKAEAVLIRAVQPIEGIDSMLKRRNAKEVKHSITAGPGSLTQALGITKEHNKTDLTGNTIWLEDHRITYSSKEIIASPRVGVSYAEEDANLPWRFRVKDSPWCSKAK